MLLANNAAIGIGATVASAPLPLGQSPSFGFEVTNSITGTLSIQVSNDGTNWYDLVAGGVHLTSVFVGLSAASRAFSFRNAGFAQARAQFVNTSGGAGTWTVNGFISPMRV